MTSVVRPPPPESNKGDYKSTTRIVSCSDWPLLLIGLRAGELLGLSWSGCSCSSIEHWMGLPGHYKHHSTILCSRLGACTVIHLVSLAASSNLHVWTVRCSRQACWGAHALMQTEVVLVYKVAGFVASPPGCEQSKLSPWGILFLCLLEMLEMKICRHVAYSRGPIGLYSSIYSWSWLPVVNRVLHFCIVPWLPVGHPGINWGSTWPCVGERVTPMWDFTVFTTFMPVVYYCSVCMFLIYLNNFRIVTLESSGLPFPILFDSLILLVSTLIFTILT